MINMTSFLDIYYLLVNWFSGSNTRRTIPSGAEFTALFGLTPERFCASAKDVFIMHPGPMNRGIEISSHIADGPNSGILTQVTNGMAMRMAVLYLVARAGSEGGFYA